MRLVHALYPIFKFSGPLGQLFCYFKRAARDVAADCGFELDELTDVKFGGWHGEASNVKPNRMYHGKIRAGDGSGWRFSAYQDSPTDGTVIRGRLGDKLERGEDFRPHEIEEMARRLWAQHLEARKKQL